MQQASQSPAAGLRKTQPNPGRVAQPSHHLCHLDRTDHPCLRSGMIPGLSREFVYSLLVLMAILQVLVQLGIWMHLKDRGHFWAILAMIFGGIGCRICGRIRSVLDLVSMIRDLTGTMIIVPVSYIFWGEIAVLVHRLFNFV